MKLIDLVTELVRYERLSASLFRIEGASEEYDHAVDVAEHKMTELKEMIHQLVETINEYGEDMKTYGYNENSFCSSDRYKEWADETRSKIKEILG